MTKSPSPSLDYKDLFESLPERYMVMMPDAPHFTIIAESDSHAEVAMVALQSIIGKTFLQAFPDTSDKYKKTGVSDVVESLKRVVKTHKPDSMDALRYDIQRPDGKLQERYWRATHYPIFDSKGKLAFICQVTADITEELRKGEELRAVRRQLDEALSVGLVGTWLWDIVGNKVIADESLSAMFGVSADQGAKGLPLKTFTDSIHPDDRARVTEHIDETIKKDAPYEVEYRTVSTDGTMRWVIARGRIEKDENGIPVRFPGVIVDISERKHAEEALKRSESEFKFMANSMPQLIWVTRPDGYHEYYNQQWYDYTGTSYEQAKGAGWNAVFHPDDQARSRKRWAHSLKTGEPYEIEYRLRNGATGEYRWFVGRALPYRDSSGKIVKWYGTCTDIHDQKVAADVQSFLSQATKLLASSLDYTTTLKAVAKLGVPGIADWCAIDMYDEATHSLQEVALVHKDPKKIHLARQLRQASPPDMNATTGVPQVLRSGEPEFVPVISQEMLQAQVSDPKIMKLLQQINIGSYMVVPLRLRDKPVGALTFVLAEQKRYYTKTDLDMAQEIADRASLAITNADLYRSAQQEITQRKQLEEKLRLANENLEQRVKERTVQLEETNQNLERSNQELQDFAYVASHDLQEPLRKIQAFGNLLEEEYGSVLGEGKDYLDRMRSAASRMSTLIEDLLAFSRVTTKARPFTDVNLEMIASEVLSDLETRMSDTGGTVKVESLPTVVADHVQMRQLLQNLLGNALKFHRPGVPPRVTLSYVPIKAKNGRITAYDIRVQDNGIGFEEKYLDRIFSVFQRLHGREHYEGTGIGLAVCRKIVERHGGTITATSKPDAGATFIITLPVKQGAQK